MLLLPLWRLTPSVSSPTGEEELQKVCYVSRFPKLDAYAAEGERGTTLTEHITWQLCYGKGAWAPILPSPSGRGRFQTPFPGVASLTPTLSRRERGSEPRAYGEKG